MKKLLKILTWCTAISVILFAALVVHLAYVVKPPVFDNNTLQLSRLDFRDKLDTTTAKDIRSRVGHIKGVKNVVVNPEGRTLVFGYDNRELAPAIVLNVVKRYGRKDVHLFEPSDEINNSGCPVLHNQSVLIQLALKVRELLN